MEQKVGIGYDIHAFKAGRKLILGGVDIPHDKGLDGHSDADVLLHALCDAVLGALGKGDIGEHFPNTDPAYKDISSLKLLEHVYDLMSKEGFKVHNCDSVIQAQEPKVLSYKDQMKENIAAALKISIDQINIKATTQEGLGAIGNSEGIAAFATALLVKE